MAAAALLAVPEVLTGFRFGNGSGTILTGLRAAGAVLLAVALHQGALRPETPRRSGPGGAERVGLPDAVRPALGGAAVIAPLGSSAPVAWLAAAAFATAAVFAWARPLRLRVSLMAGLLLQAGAELLATAPRGGRRPTRRAASPMPRDGCGRVSTHRQDPADRTSSGISRAPSTR